MGGSGAAQPTPAENSADRARCCANQAAALLADGKFVGAAHAGGQAAAADATWWKGHYFKGEALLALLEGKKATGEVTIGLEWVADPPTAGEAAGNVQATLGQELHEAQEEQATLSTQLMRVSQDRDRLAEAVVVRHCASSREMRRRRDAIT